MYNQMTEEQLVALRPKVGPAAQERIDETLNRIRMERIAAKPASSTWEGIPGVSESAVQNSIVKRLRQLTIAVYSLSQYRPSNQTEGLPDLIAFCPIRGMFYIEVKAIDGVQSDAQKVFQQRCNQAGIPYILGGLHEVETFLKGGDTE